MVQVTLFQVDNFIGVGTYKRTSRLSRFRESDFGVLSNRKHDRIS
jgi:hypothetical protein